MRPVWRHFGGLLHKWNMLDRAGTLENVGMGHIVLASSVASVHAGSLKCSGN